MANIISEDFKLKKAREFINLYLKDPTLFCKCCGAKYDGTVCCEDPYIVDNMRDVMDYISANKETKSKLLNKFGSTKNKHMRFSIRMPKQLMRALQNMFRQYNEDFLVEVDEAEKFMREFPQFSIAESI